ncbi:Hypp6859 [Branchiostoma lanceolatum]|uniref:Hypp6859 protein n=1 Tax=Branchiostoma lanceolatum TaxID=7740 RepID=A0A8J9YVK7_BRALA|nr:Hypp6859 [Branchiostoma lanceolatum]
MGTVRIIPNRNTINENTDNAQLHHTIDEEAAVYLYEGGEDYETQQASAAVVYREMEETRENGLDIEGKNIKVQWYLTADWKFVATLLGLNQASNKSFCIWCHCTKGEIAVFTQPSLHSKK